MSYVCIINSHIVQLLFVEYTKVVIIIITLMHITSSTTHTHMIRPFDADLTISYSRDSSLSKSLPWTVLHKIWYCCLKGLNVVERGSHR